MFTNVVLEQVEYPKFVYRSRVNV